MTQDREGEPGSISKINAGFEVSWVMVRAGRNQRKMKLRKIPQTRREANRNAVNLLLIAIVLDLAVLTDCLGAWGALGYMVWAWWIPIRRWEPRPDDFCSNSQKERSGVSRVEVAANR